MTWRELPTQRELPRVVQHVDYGVRRPVLVQRRRGYTAPDRVLIIRPGHSCWSANGDRSYAPTELQLALVTDQWEAVTLYQGRLSKAVLRALSFQIASWFGVQVQQLPPIHRRKTFVWQEAP